MTLPSSEEVLRGIGGFLAGPSFDTAVMIGAVSLAVIILGWDIWEHGWRQDR